MSEVSIMTRIKKMQEYFHRDVGRVPNEVILGRSEYHALLAELSAMDHLLRTSSVAVVFGMDVVEVLDYSFLRVCLVVGDYS